MFIPGFDRQEFSVATADGHKFRLLEPVTFTRRNGDTILLPVGTESDGASVPRQLWASLPPFGDHWKSAFLHDAAYRMRTRPVIGSKQECDSLFAEALELCKVPDIERHILSRGVAIFGEDAYLAARMKA